MNKYKLACADTEEDVEDCFSQMSASPVIQTGDNSYLYFLDMEIGKSSQYRNLISFLRTADEDDTLDMIICNDGGELFTTLNVCEEILNSPVTVRASVRGRCCSGATFFILAADQVESDDCASIMFHSASGPTFGKFHETSLELEHWKSLFPKMVDKYYKYILSPEEISQLLDGKDFWLSGEELMERVANRSKILEEEFLAEQEYELTQEEFTSLFEKAKADKRKKIDRERKNNK